MAEGRKPVDGAPAIRRGGACGQTASVGAIFERAYRQFADRPALVDGDRRLTYAELGRRAHRVAGALGALGLRRGDRVVLLSGNRREFVECDHALFTGGFVRVALSVRLHPREVAGILADCGARAVVADEAWAGRLAEVRADAPELEHVIALGEHEPDGAIGYEPLVAEASPEPPARPPAADDLAALLYTSGTTGRPKGATLSHGNWVAMMRNSMVELPPIGEDDVVLHVAPLSHLSGYVAPTYFARGAMHVTLPRFEPVETLRALERHRVTTLPLVPTMLNLLTLAAEDAPPDASALRTVVYAGSAIAPDRLARAVRLFGEVFVQFYGLSEFPMPLTALSARDHRIEPGAPPPARLASAGRPSPYVELVVAGPDGDAVAPGEVGEIVVRGDTVMQGYWGNPELTAETVDPDGWARTGDLGRLDDDGYLTIVDRKKDMIVTGGYNVYPAEIEHAISTLDEVEEVAVVGVPDERFGEAIKAVVVPRPGRSVEPQAVIDACAAQLAGYKKPRSVDLVDELPKTGSGKIVRRALRERFWEAADRRV